MARSIIKMLMMAGPVRVEARFLIKRLIVSMSILERLIVAGTDQHLKARPD